MNFDVRLFSFLKEKIDWLKFLVPQNLWRDIFPNFCRNIFNFTQPFKVW
jgi:hypothetical protein